MFGLLRSSSDDLEEIARCHRLCFSGSLSCKLGPAYTKKMLEWFVADEHRFLFHIINDGKVVGYCGGFFPQFIGDGSTSGIMRYAMSEALKGVLIKPWLLMHKEVIAFYPLLGKNILKKIFKHKSGQREENMFAVFEKRIGLVVIGVHPNYRGKGVFEMLMNEFEKETLKKQIHKMYLSVKKDNFPAIKAYQKAGWHVALENPLSLEMNKNIR